jgi:tetratricopeptide (TPR) repeat protein
MIFKPDQHATSGRLRKAGLIAGALALAMLGACNNEPALDAGLAPIEAAQAQLSRGDGVDAEATLKRMLESGTNAPELAAFMGEAAMLQGDLAKARRWLGKGEFSPETAAYGFQLLGRLELREGNLPASGGAFDNALKFDPKKASLWVDIGRLRYRGGEQLQALEAAQYAMELDAQDPAVLHFGAQLMRDSEGKVPSLALFEKALEKTPNDLGLLTDYAATLGDLGRNADALAAIRKVAEIAPKAPRIHYLQAVIAARAGQHALARSLLLASPAEEQELPAAQLLAGVLDMEAENYASAALNLDRLYARQKDNRTVRRLLMRALYQSGAEKELVSRFGEMAALERATPYEKTLIARAYEALGEPAKAGPLLDAAARPSQLTLVPLPSALPQETLMTARSKDGRETRDVVRAFLRPGTTGTAVASARQFTQRFPGSGDAFSLLGDAKLGSGDERGALAAYAQAAKIRRSWPLTLRQMAAFVSLGDQAAADAVLGDFIKNGGRSPKAASLYARVLAGRGDWERAAEMLGAAIAMGDGRAPDTLALRSIAAARLDQKDEARVFATRAYRISPAYAPAIVALIQVSDDEALKERLQKKLDILQRSAR